MMLRDHSATRRRGALLSLLWHARALAGWRAGLVVVRACGRGCGVWLWGVPFRAGSASLHVCMAPLRRPSVAAPLMYTVVLAAITPSSSRHGSLSCRYDGSVWLPAALKPQNPLDGDGNRTAAWASATVFTTPPPASLALNVTGVRYAWGDATCCPTVERDVAPCPANNCPIQVRPFGRSDTRSTARYMTDPGGASV